MSVKESYAGKINRKLNKKLHVIDVAAGRAPADLVLKNASYVNVFSHQICSGDIAVAECSPEGMRVERPGPAGPFVCAANLFHSDLAVPLPPGLDSWRAAERYDTMRRVLEREGETLALSDVQALLAGRKGFLCQYDRAAGRDTVWSAACDLTRRRCLLAEGNPGRTAFREIPFPVERGDSRP